MLTEFGRVDEAIGGVESPIESAVYERSTKLRCLVYEQRAVKEVVSENKHCKRIIAKQAGCRPATTHTTYTWRIQRDVATPHYGKPTINRLCESDGFTLQKRNASSSLAQWLGTYLSTFHR